MSTRHNRRPDHETGNRVADPQLRPDAVAAAHRASPAALLATLHHTNDVHAAQRRRLHDNEVPLERAYYIRVGQHAAANLPLAAPVHSGFGHRWRQHAVIPSCLFSVPAVRGHYIE